MYKLCNSTSKQYLYKEVRDMLENIFYLFLIILSCILFRETYAFPVFSFLDIPGSEFFPRIILGIMILLSLILLLNNLIYKNKNKVFSLRPSPIQTKFTVLILIYLVVMPYLHYFFSTVLFLIASMLLLTPKKEGKEYIRIGGITTMVVLLIYYVFAENLKIFLP